MFYVPSAAKGDLRISQTFTGPVEGKRKRGRQRYRWTDNAEEWTGNSGEEEKDRGNDGQTMQRNGQGTVEGKRKRGRQRKR